MVIGKVLDVDPTGTLFYLPHHRRDVLCLQRNNLDAMTPSLLSTFLPLYLGAEHHVRKCFKKDGPLGIKTKDVLTI